MLCSRSLVYGLWSMVSIAALPRRAGQSNGARSAAVLGRINVTTDRTPASITQTRRPIVDRLGAGKNARAPKTRWTKQRRQERGRPRPHQPDDQSCVKDN
ncbi:MAG: hypothetical protein GX456_05265 [Verrucomicrobia bacterium]|nr:hypothetical protein [Verrucomicrobiota bacterium]